MRRHAPDACRSSGRTVHPGLVPAIVRLPFVRRSIRSFAGGGTVPLTISGELWIFIDWTLRCGWLQVESCNIMLMRAARLVITIPAGGGNYAEKTANYDGRCAAEDRKVRAPHTSCANTKPGYKQLCRRSVPADRRTDLTSTLRPNRIVMIVSRVASVGEITYSRKYHSPSLSVFSLPSLARVFFMSPLRRHIFVCFMAKSTFWRGFSALAPYTGVSK